MAVFRSRAARLTWWSGGIVFLSCAIVVELTLDSSARAVSRDFAAPSEAVEPVHPRSGPVFASFGIGLDYVSGAWRESDTARRGETNSGGLLLRAEMGVVVRQRVALFLDGQARAPVVPPIVDLYMAGIGAGVTVFLPYTERWHLDFEMRRAWAEKSTFCCSAQTPPPIESFDEIWLGEVGVGYFHRRGRTDRGWTLSVLGGPIRSAGVSGWMAGSALTYAWSRS